MSRMRWVSSATKLGKPKVPAVFVLLHCGRSVSKNPKVIVEVLRTKSARAQFSMPSPGGALDGRVPCCRDRRP